MKDIYIEPKRKRVFDPLPWTPLPIEVGANPGVLLIFGRLSADTVLVSDPYDVDYLSNNGCFGIKLPRAVKIRRNTHTMVANETVKDWGATTGNADATGSVTETDLQGISKRIGTREELYTSVPGVTSDSSEAGTPNNGHSVYSNSFNVVFDNADDWLKNELFDTIPNRVTESTETEVVQNAKDNSRPSEKQETLSNVVEDEVMSGAVSDILETITNNSDCHRNNDISGSELLSGDNLVTSVNSGILQTQDLHSIPVEVSRVPANSSEDSQLEYLELSLIEAMFLCYALGMLWVRVEGVVLSVNQLWAVGLGGSTDFPGDYFVYHHFRAKGWTVRNGSRYGADYLLYKKGPHFYHASYCVFVEHVNKESMRCLYGRGCTDWRLMVARCRVVENVSKAMLVCYVLHPNDIDYNHPNCLKELEIQEIIIRRFVPNKNRESFVVEENT